jgi:hypothetical protein
VAWALPLHSLVPFLVARRACPALRWSALRCAGLVATSSTSYLDPAPGFSASVYCPQATSPQVLLSDQSWLDTEAPERWWHPAPPVPLPFVGSQTQDHSGGQGSAQAALWGGPGMGYALSLKADEFGPVCGRVEPGWVERPTPEWIRALRRAQDR